MFEQPPVNPFNNSHGQPKQNFSLQYQYKTEQTSDGNTGKHQIGVY